MIKVLLVDDNRFALEYFSQLISWEAYGFEIIATALDGEFAFTQFLKYSPQLIITDIQMPNIDGIELAQKVLSAAPETVIIFLSSYEEFKYAQSALHLGVYDYIIKHEVTEEILAQKLTDIRAKIQSTTIDRRLINEGNLRYLINTDRQTPSEKFRQIFHSFPDQYDLGVLIQDHIYPEFRRFSFSDQEITENKLKNFLYQYPEVLAAVRIDQYTYVLLLRSIRSFYETANAIGSGFCTAFHTTASIILVSEKAGIRRCYQDYLQTSETLERKYFYPPSSILHNNIFQISLATATTSPEEVYRSLAENQEFEELYQKLQEEFQSVLLLRDPGAFRSLTHIALDILFHCQQQTIYSGTSYLFDLSHKDIQTYWYDASSIFHWLLKQFSLLAQLHREHGSGTYSKTVREVIFFIRQNYSNSDLSVENIARHFGINMNQLNYLFKKEVGETVIKYLIQVRMEQARKLLDHKGLKISEISEKTGYSTVSYFSNVFKKYYGVSPLEYRRTHDET